MQPWAEDFGKFAKPGETVEHVVRGRDGIGKEVKVENTSKSKMWYCGFCGEACHVRNIVQHLVKAHTGKRGSGCGSVSVDALRQLICFIEAKDAMLAEEKIEEIEKGPEDKDEKNPPSSPQPKAKGKRSEPKASPRASRGSRKAETTKSDKSPPKTGKSKEDKSELKEGKSQTPQKKGKKNEKIEDEDLPKAKKEKKTEEPPAASGRKRKENISGAKSPPPKKGKKTETKRSKEIDADAAFVMSATDDEEMVEEMETEDPNETYLGIDGLENETPPEVSLVASAESLKKTLLVTFEEEKVELPIEVPLKDDESDFLTKKLWDEGPNWCSIIGSTSDVKIVVRWDAASIEAEHVQCARNAALILKKMLEFHLKGGIVVDETRRHPLMTLVKAHAGPIKPSDREWFTQLSEMHQVCLIPARVDSPFELVPNSLVEVPEIYGWIPARIIDEPYMDRAWVSLENGSKKEVDIFTLRSGYDIIAIFGEPEQRVHAQLQLMSSCWPKQQDFGLNSQLALAEDGDWGTYRKFFHDETFIATFSDYVGKVLSSASGCACKFIGQMFFATGFRPARWCAASMINDLEKVHKNWGEIPTFQENKSFSLRIKPSRESIQDILKRKVGNSLGIEDEFQTMLLLTRSKKKNDVLHLPYNMPLEVFYAGKWREATKIMGQNDEETDENPQIKVAWPGSDSLTSVHPLPDVRTLGSEVLCYSRDPFKRTCMALHLLAKTAELSSDDGFQARQQIHKLPGAESSLQILDEKIYVEVLHKRNVRQRIARAAHCGVETVGRNLVLYGDEDAQKFAKQLLDCAVQQKGEALASLVPKVEGLAEVELTEEEVKVLNEGLMEQVERKAKVYMFLRDDQSQQHYSHGQSIEFLWRKRPDETGKWCQGTFLRRCVGSGQQVKIRYEDQQKDCETTVNVKDVRPEESQRKKPAMCLMTRESNYSGRGGLAVAEKLLKAGLRDALGKASTGQGWKKGGKGGGKGGDRPQWGGQKQSWNNWKDQKWENKNWNQSSPSKWQKETWNEKGDGPKNEQSQWQKNEKDDWQKNQKDDWRKNQKDDWQNSQKDDWQKNQKDDWRAGQKEDWRKNQKDDWHKNQKDDWQKTQKDDWRKNQKDAWQKNQKDDWQTTQKDDWRTGQKDDWHKNQSDGWQQKDTWRNKGQWQNNEEPAAQEVSASTWNSSQGESWTPQLADQTGAPADQNPGVGMESAAQLAATLVASHEAKASQIYQTPEVAEAEHVNFQRDFQFMLDSHDANTFPETFGDWAKAQHTFFPQAFPLPNGWHRALSKDSRKIYFIHVEGNKRTHDIKECFTT